MFVFFLDSIVKQIYEVFIVVIGIKYLEDNLFYVLSDVDYLEIFIWWRNFIILFVVLDYINFLDIEYVYKLDDN